MTLTHHDAAHGNERCGRKAELLGPQKGRNGYIPPGFQLAVSLQHHPGTQVVQHKRLMGFGDPQLPRNTGVLDGGERRCAGTAGVAGNHQVIRTGLGNAGRHGADTNLGAELYADSRLGIGVLQIVDQLGHVLDGIDVMVRRWADEADAGSGMSNACNDVVHFVAGQLAAFAGLRTLDDLDLQLVGVGEIVDRHAETAAGHLLDGAALRITVCERYESGRVLATFTRVRFATQSIHGDGQRFVGLGAYGTEAHGARRESLDDFLFRFDLLELNGTAIGSGSERKKAS